METNKDLDEYFDDLAQFKAEANLLRVLILKAGLLETIKWGGPIYTYKSKNVIGLAVFKNYVGLWFFKGAALKDELKILVKGSEKTHTQRQWRFNNIKEINKKQVTSYIQEAILLEEQGVQPTIPKPVIIDDLLLSALANDKLLSKAWEALSKSCKREYIDYINEAKKIETKLARIEKSKPIILSAKGLHDKYR